MNNGFLNYKGYSGTSEMSPADCCYYGKIVRISDLVTYEAESAEALREAFAKAVEYYLEKCRREGMLPDEPSGDLCQSVTG